ncbi:MAG: type II toxin-antitoxin system Phd/YefM family antitoxin [Polyangiaceae bacterium]|jgi:prevent-host-death family protein
MASYPVYEAKARLSALLREVKAHREVIITERGKRIARLVPFADDADETLDARIERLAARGVIEPAADTSRGPLVSAAAPSKGALRRFLNDRG